MFKAAELGQKVAKQEYQEQVPDLRMRLLSLQYELRERDFPVIVVLSGNDRRSCNEVLNLLHEWMDPRFVKAGAWNRVSDEERERPLFWRYWRTMPARGEIGVFLHAWTMEAISLRMAKQIDAAGQERLLGHARALERCLAADGALIVKFWLHLPEKPMRKRLESVIEGKNHRMLLTKKEARSILRDYDRTMSLMEAAVVETSIAEAPWHVVESRDSRYRNLTVAKIFERELSRRLQEASVPAEATAPAAAAEPTTDPVTVLDKVDLTATLPKEEYEKALGQWQRKLTRLSRKALDRGLSTVLLFEGWDAAGKGGIVRRITSAMDASLYRVIPIAAPTDEERARHYLWRFWRHLPRAGQMAIFDRTWYGRVLVERVEGFATEAEWKRAYAEINDFEEQLHEHGTVLLKFWLHIDPDEQLSRFKAREQTPFKKYKITEDDYRNRERWNDYELAVDEMVQRTSTKAGRWHVIAANDKRWARIDGLRAVCGALSAALKNSKKR